MPDQPLNPWDKRKGEHARRFTMFAAYRDMGYERTHAEVARQFGITAQRVRIVATEADWTARADAYDRYIDQQKQFETLAETKKMIETHAAFARKMLGMAAKRLEAMEKAGEHLKLSPAEARHWVAEGIDHERRAHGMPSQTVAAGGAGPFGTVTKEPPKIEVVFVRPADKK